MPSCYEHFCHPCESSWHQSSSCRTMVVVRRTYVLAALCALGQHTRSSWCSTALQGHVAAVYGFLGCSPWWRVLLQVQLCLDQGSTPASSFGSGTACVIPLTSCVLCGARAWTRYLRIFYEFCDILGWQITAVQPDLSFWLIWQDSCTWEGGGQLWRCELFPPRSPAEHTSVPSSGDLGQGWTHNQASCTSTEQPECNSVNKTGAANPHYLESPQLQSDFYQLSF